MLESERLAYLDALGITQYLALAPISGGRELPELVAEQIWAAAPDAVDSSAEDVSAVPGKVEPVTAPSEFPTEPQAHSDIDIKPEPPPEKVEEEEGVPRLDLSKLNLETEVSTRPVSRQPVKAQQFALAVITIPDQYRLFVELELADAPGLSAVEHRMVSDLLMLLGQSDGLDQVGAKLYRWPMVNNPRIAADTQAARDGLLGFVASAPVVSRNVFLGMKATSVLATTTPGELFSLTGSGDPDSLATYSLAEMQQDWQLKAAFWGNIYPFLSNFQ